MNKNIFVEKTKGPEQCSGPVFIHGARYWERTRSHNYPNLLVAIEVFIPEMFATCIAKITHQDSLDKPLH